VGLATSGVPPRQLYLSRSGDGRAYDGNTKGNRQHGKDDTWGHNGFPIKSSPDSYLGAHADCFNGRITPKHGKKLAASAQRHDYQ